MIKNNPGDPLSDSPLGKTVAYPNTYTPTLLCPIPRYLKRVPIGITDVLPFEGVDTWRGYELSWLNTQGKPVVAVAQFDIPAHSPHLIESKSFKLYLNTFNQTSFTSSEKVLETLIQDLTHSAGAPVSVMLWDLDTALHQTPMRPFDGICLDTLDVVCDRYEVFSDYLQIDEATTVTEILYSDLLRSNCLVTGQPDFGSVKIAYTGPKIDRAGLLRYIVSYRNHQGFHEMCVEQIFMDILTRCMPSVLTVDARYTRRGGLDINPLRSTLPVVMAPLERLVRQ